MDQTILGVDIGSTKISAIIASKKGEEIHIIGTGFHKSQGLKKGSVTNIEQASRAIKDAVSDARRVAGSNVNRAVVSISGAYTKSTDSHGILHIQNNEIGIKEINRVIQTALYNASIPNEYEVIHILPYKFKLDDQDFIDDPMEMTGSRLEVFVRIITAQKSGIGNLKKAIKSAGLEIGNIVLSSYASSIAALSDAEKELGVCCIDMGGSTCELMIHIGNSLRYNDFLGVGSNHITNDLAMALYTQPNVAELVKTQYGNLSKDGANSNDLIEVPNIGGDENSKSQIPLKTVYTVVSMRVEETLFLLEQSLERSGLKTQIGSGVVLTGGMTKLEGLRDLANSIFGLPVRIAKPVELSGLFNDLKYPEYTTAVGLILYAAGNYTNYEVDSEKNIRSRSENFKGETLPNHGGMGIMNPLQSTNLQNSPVNSVTKSAVDIKQDLSEITKIKKIHPNNENIFQKVWKNLTSMF